MPWLGNVGFTGPSRKPAISRDGAFAGFQIANFEAEQFIHVT